MLLPFPYLIMVISKISLIGALKCCCKSMLRPFAIVCMDEFTHAWTSCIEAYVIYLVATTLLKYYMQKNKQKERRKRKGPLETTQLLCIKPS